MIGTGIQLNARQKITIAVNLLTMEDPYVYIRDASGTILGEADDGSGGRGSRLVFTAPTTGTYYVDVAAWVNDGSDPDYTGTGTYALSVTNYVPPPVGTLDQFANQMTHGFFNGDATISTSRKAVRSPSTSRRSRPPGARLPCRRCSSGPTSSA